MRKGNSERAIESRQQQGDDASEGRDTHKRSRSGTLLKQSALSPTRHRVPASRRRVVLPLLALGLGLLVLNYPPLNLVNRPDTIGGIPVLVVYIFGLWLAIIFVAIVLARAPDLED